MRRALARELRREEQAARTGLPGSRLAQHGGQIDLAGKLVAQPAQGGLERQRGRAMLHSPGVAWHDARTRPPGSAVQRSSTSRTWSRGPGVDRRAATSGHDPGAQRSGGPVARATGDGTPPWVA